MALSGDQKTLIYSTLFILGVESVEEDNSYVRY